MAAAVVAATMANVNRGTNSRAFTVEDFLVRWDRAVREMSPEEIWAQVQQAHAAISAAGRH